MYQCTSQQSASNQVKQDIKRHYVVVSAKHKPLHSDYTVPRNVLSTLIQQNVKINTNSEISQTTPQRNTSVLVQEDIIILHLVNKVSITKIKIRKCDIVCHSLKYSSLSLSRRLSVFRAVLITVKPHPSVTLLVIKLSTLLKQAICLSVKCTCQDIKPKVNSVFITSKFPSVSYSSIQQCEMCHQCLSLNNPFVFKPQNIKRIRHSVKALCDFFLNNNITLRRNPVCGACDLSMAAPTPGPLVQTPSEEDKKLCEYYLPPLFRNITPPPYSAIGYLYSTS